MKVENAQDLFLELQKMTEKERAARPVVVMLEDDETNPDMEVGDVTVEVMETCVMITGATAWERPF